MNKVTKRIVEITGRAVTECQCESCKGQCKSVCLGTPDDILALIDAGYGEKLELTKWMIGMIMGEVPFPVNMVQAKQTENGCVFFKDGLCELHALGLKPTEGRLSHHSIRLDNFIFEKSLSWQVAKEWLSLENIDKIISIVLYMRTGLRVSFKIHCR